MGVIFLFIMIIITYSIDKSVENTFVINSLHLPISIARIHDEEEVSNTIALHLCTYISYLTFRILIPLQTNIPTSR